MKRIATLTVNPAIDKYTTVDRVRPDRKLRCERPTREPGGGGLNVSRAVQRLGGEATALYMAGGPTGDILRDLLDAEGIPQHVLPIAGWTRENLIVNEEGSEQQYRFGMPGPEVSEEEKDRCLEALRELDPAPDLLVASGSLSPGLPEDFLGQVAEVAAEIDARFIVDTSGEPLRHAVEAGAFLLKPNTSELEDLAGEALETEKAQEEAARRFIEEGCCQVIVLSLGSGGAVMFTGERTEHIRAPTVPIRSKVGAGDSMVGGIVLGLARGMELPDAVRFGVAAGAAAVMTEGTELCRREDTERLFEEIRRG